MEKHIFKGMPLASATSTKALVYFIPRWGQVQGLNLPVFLLNPEIPCLTHHPTLPVLTPDWALLHISKQKS